MKWFINEWDLNLGRPLRWFLLASPRTNSTFLLASPRADSTWFYCFKCFVFDIACLFSSLATFCVWTLFAYFGEAQPFILEAWDCLYPVGHLKPILEILRPRPEALRLRRANIGYITHWKGTCRLSLAALAVPIRGTDGYARRRWVLTKNLILQWSVRLATQSLTNSICSFRLATQSLTNFEVYYQFAKDDLSIPMHPKNIISCHHMQTKAPKLKLLRLNIQFFAIS